MARSNIFNFFLQEEFKSDEGTSSGFFLVGDFEGKDGEDAKGEGRFTVDTAPEVESTAASVSCVQGGSLIFLRGASFSFCLKCDLEGEDAEGEARFAVAAAATEDAFSLVGFSDADAGDANRNGDPAAAERAPRLAVGLRGAPYIAS